MDKNGATERIDKNDSLFEQPTDRGVLNGIHKKFRGPQFILSEWPITKGLLIIGEIDSSTAVCLSLLSCFENKLLQEKSFKIQKIIYLILDSKWRDGRCIGDPGHRQPQKHIVQANHPITWTNSANKHPSPMSYR